jgi:single-stranded DNA-binding protein
MNSFKLTAIGNLARNPELTIKGEITFARFCLVGHDELGEGEQDGPREVLTSLWFIAFGESAEDIAINASKGDQLILEARVVANQWTDGHGDLQRGHTFIVTGFRFGSRRGEPGSPTAARHDPPDTPSTGGAEVSAEEVAI